MGNTDWNKLGFGYTDTNCNIRCYYKNGQWGELEVSTETTINLHMAATCLHYGQEAFEGLKAYRGKDGKIRVFRMDENAKRMQSSARGILMPEVPEELFKEAIVKAIKMNSEFVPPAGVEGASLYIRPLLIGSGPQIGVKPATEYMFMVFVMPVGPYFKEGFRPTDYVIYREYDRAAPLGTGTIKVGGNYAASLKAGVRAHNEGYSAVLYLDAREKKYIDECGPANFFGIKGNTYVTPKSKSILPSITNKSLRQLAEDMGMKVEERPVAVEELADFSEAGACGTAAVISPIRSIYDADRDIRYTYGDEPGEVSVKLYEKLIGIQYGDEPDVHNWVRIIE
ncbi:branched-chain amino acid aminotransferase [Roseimarinus sediminis]|uniref:branched-chain amino acid aminotransferase n=1 Tax=Roseimarinus sediminis TaxID=1610899 RepID=UPI003D22C319